MTFVVAAPGNNIFIGEGSLSGRGGSKLPASTRDEVVDVIVSRVLKIMFMTAEDDADPSRSGAPLQQILDLLLAPMLGSCTVGRVMEEWDAPGGRGRRKGPLDEGLVLLFIEIPFA